MKEYLRRNGPFHEQSSGDTVEHWFPTFKEYCKQHFEQYTYGSLTIKLAPIAAKVISYR